MTDITLLITDDRYSVSTLQLVQARTSADVHRLAHEALSESDHHHAVEAWAGDRRLVVLKAHDEPVGCG